MKKYIAMVLCLLLLTGCGTPKEIAPPLQSEAPEETVLQLVQVYDTVDLTQFPKESPYNQTGQVGVHAPMVTESGIYTMEAIDLTKEEAFYALRPEDQSALQMVDDYGNQRLVSDSGMSLALEGDWLSVSIRYDDKFQQRSSIFSEIRSLLQWKLEHGETESQDLPFASKKQVQNQCEATLSALGIGLQPTLTGCIGMKHSEAEEYQQQLRKTEETYDSFGTTLELTELDKSYDCYYVTYSFCWDGIPVYGCELFPEFSRADLMERYRNAYAVFLVSQDGIQDCVISGAFQTPQLQQTQSVLSAEDAAQTACIALDKDLSILQEDTRIEYVSFCLTPAYDRTTRSYQLMPMWGAEISTLGSRTGNWISSNTGTEIFLDGITGDRIC